MGETTVEMSVENGYTLLIICIYYEDTDYLNDSGGGMGDG